MPAGLRWRLSEAFDNLKTRNLVGTPTVQPEVRRQLIKVCREDILKLQEQLGRDLSRWLE
jgi:hypothetical protein